MRIEVPDPGKVVPEDGVGYGLRAGTSVADPPDLSTEPPHPDLLFEIPVCPESSSLYHSPRCMSEKLVLCIGPLETAPGILADSFLFLADRVPGDFRFQMLYRLLFLALVLCFGGPGVGLRTHAPQWGILQLRYPSGFLAAAPGFWDQLFLPFLPVFM